MSSRSWPSETAIAGLPFSAPSIAAPTVPEYAMSKRVNVAYMLSEKRVYSEIVAKTGASTATVSRVNRSLNYGCDGYDLVFKRLPDEVKPK